MSIGIVYDNQNIFLKKCMQGREKIFSMHREKDAALELFLKSAYKKVDGYFTYYDYVKCVHDLMLQQEYLIKLHSFAFISFDENHLQCSDDNTFFLSNSRLIYKISADKIFIDIRYTSFVTNIDKEFFKNVPTKIHRYCFEYSLSKWIISKSGQNFKGTKLGFFIDRAMKNNDVKYKKPIFI